MKRTLMICALIGLFAATAVAGEQATAPQGDKAVKAKAQPVVEVAFVLDTTGSMSGLIAGAKAKIWHIANQIVLGEPRPKVKMALVAYRDKGDEYVTKVFDLTDNIDEVYKDLQTFTAGGGGDTPENVNQALHDAVHKLQWSAAAKTLKIIYLVGDSPPHNEYKDVPTYDKTAAEAIKKGIYINTVLCGGNMETAKIWQEIARSAEGTYAAIDQSGGVKVVATPYDEKLAKLNADLTATVVTYGEKSKREALEKLAKDSTLAPKEAQAGRASFAAQTGSAATGDLVDAVREKKVELGKIDQEKLPDAMQKMDAEEQRAYVAKVQEKRNQINAEIKDLAAKRDAFLKEKARTTEGAKDAFDAKVLGDLKRQAAKVGIEYKE